MKTEQLTQMELAEFCSGLSLLLHSGLGLADSVWLLEQEAGSKTKTILTRLGKLLDDGDQLSSAMEQAGGFSGYVTAMTRIGEQTGRLEEALRELGAYYEENDRTLRQLKTALTYPCVILAVMLVVIGVLLVKVLPVFDGVYASLGSRLTGLSAGLLYLGQLLRAVLPGLLAVLVLGGAAVLAVFLWPALGQKAVGLWQKRFSDRGVARKFNNARFARGLAMGLSSGLPLAEAAALAEKLLHHSPGGTERAARCRQALEQDMPLSDALQTGELLPPWACRLVCTGIRSGSGDRVLEEVARRLLEDARNALEEQVSRVEPAMVLICSVLVGIILLSAMLPLMNIMASIG